MVSVFKLTPKTTKIHAVDRDTAERVIGRKAPWCAPGTLRDEDRHFAICPYCNNAIQFIGIYRGDGSRRPHGRHLPYQYFSFAPFDPVELDLCPYSDKSNQHIKTDRRKGAASAAMMRLLRDEFDRIIYTISRDCEITISDTQAATLLAAYLKNEGWLYRDAHLRNLPWMLVYQGKNIDLFAQRILDPKMRAAISERNPDAIFSEDHRLRSRPRADGKSSFVRIELQFLYHRQTKTDDGLEEMLTLRVLDYSNDKMGDEATVFQRQFPLDFQQFERLVNTPPDRARRRISLIDVAQSLIPEEWTQ